MSARVVSLSIELDPDAEPIHAWIVDAQGRGRNVTGWLELAEALEDARTNGGLAREQARTVAAEEEV